MPQGSALGPLLFLVYVNAMPSLVQYGRLLQFADDTTLICSGDTHDDVQWQLEHDLRLLSSWINSSKMRLNVTKSSLMWFKSKHGSGVPHPPIYIDGHLLQEVEEQKYLGILFDSKLQWRSHLSYVCKKASYYLYLLSLHRKSLTFDILKMLVESLIFTRFDYAIPVWGPPLQQCQVARLQHLQNRAVRVTKSLRKYDRISAHPNNLNWLPISHQIRLRRVCAMFRYYRQKENVCYWTHLFNLVGSTCIRLVVGRILQVLHYVVSPAQKEIFVLQPPPGGICYLRLYMIVL